MAASLADVITEVRGVLQDLDPANYRYGLDRIVSAYNSALREIARVRPDVFVGGYSVPVPTAVYATTLDPTTVVFPLPEWMIIPVSNYIVGRISLSDDEFVLDGRAMTLMQAFTQSLIGGS